ncbi:hypothetical protein SEA_ALTADENA_12 [Arthrobacter phage Altadena]|uniref:Uncharacterized protein n=1 Tax=Arthrobacter phage Altadena TaxID=3059064 RepID=A0AA96HVI2_9CAUD|nr:hypothetical protein SEA_ALTADENA_12 [Arthrobacter phage Altadena]
MWGPEGLTRAAAANLEAALPVAVARLRAKYGITAAELPDVAAVYPTPRDFAEIGDYPCVMLAAQETQGQLDTRQTGATGEYDEYMLTYRLRAMIFCMGTSYDRTELLTQRIVLAVREALLMNKRYGDPEAGDGGVLDARLLRESYAETASSSGGFLGGAWVEIGVRSAERLYTTLPSVPVDDLRTSVGSVAASETVSRVEVHPALIGEP